MLRSMLTTVLCVLATAALAVGCPDDDGPEAPRTTGPHADEYGKVTYWKVTAAPPLEYSQCTDAASFRDAIDAPEFSANSFLMYKVNAGGATAAGQSCTTTAASSCSDSGRTWNVSNSVLTFTDDPTNTPQTGSPCTLRFDNLWTVTDMGTTARMEVAMNVSLVPDTPADQQACDDLDAATAATGTNNLGLNGCVVTIPVELEFFKAE